MSTRENEANPLPQDPDEAAARNYVDWLQMIPFAPGDPPMFQVGVTRALRRSIALQRLQQEVGEIDVPPDLNAVADKIRRNRERAMRKFRKELRVKTQSDTSLLAASPARKADFLAHLRSIVRRKHPRISLSEEEPAKLAPHLSYFDWRLSGCVPPVRDQKDCNTCWAFAATAAYESRLNYNLSQVHIEADPDQGNFPPRVALSVQCLLNCTEDNNGCQSGFHMSAFHQFFKKGARILAFRQDGSDVDVQGEILGAPKDPGQKDDCKQIRKSGVKAVAWDFVANAPDKVPSNAALKKALLEHGPLAVTVLISEAFKAYKGGVFFHKPEFGGQTPHAMLLTGWDDRKGEKGAWILQNSYGEDWGEACVDLDAVQEAAPTSFYAKKLAARPSGCIYMRYDENGLGRFAAWVEAPFEIPPTLLPNSDAVARPTLA